MKKNHLSDPRVHETSDRKGPSSFGSHPMETATPVPGRSMAPVSATEGPVQREKVGPDAIPDAHVAYEYIAKLAYRDPGTIQTDPQVVDFLAKFGYNAAAARITEGESGMAMLYIPCMEEGKMSPILAFRGTEPTDLSDLLADIDLSYIGEPQFTNNKELIEATLLACKEPAILLGHSLGGALAQKAAFEYSSLTKEVVTFQAPGLGLAEKSKGEDRDDLPKATHHIADNDLVDRAGFYRLPGDVYSHDSSLRPFKSHTTPMFGTSEFDEERAALGIGTTVNEDGKEIDNILGHEIRQQDPDKSHIDKHEKYPGGRSLSGLPLEVIRSGAGVVKTAGEVVVGAGKLLGRGLEAIGDGLGGLFGKDGKDVGEQDEKTRPNRRPGPRGGRR